MVAQNEGEIVKTYCEGCFDFAHFGHANLLRQAKALGNYLIAGVNSDKDIERFKGPPVFNVEERCRLVGAVKWVDEVIPDAPYIPTVEFLDRNGLAFCCHGEDVSTGPDGSDLYTEVKQAGRYRECKRTDGISTTDIVGRMLLLTKNHHTHETTALPADTKNANSFNQLPSQFATCLAAFAGNIMPTTVKDFLSSAHIFTLFSNERKRMESDKVVYCPGSFDMFHVGHVEFLEKAAHYGTFLIVGLHSDDVANDYMGDNFPIMNLHERVLNVLACRYVDEVVICAPYDVTEGFIQRFEIDVVCHGIKPQVAPTRQGTDPFQYPKQAGIFVGIESGNSLTARSVVERIIQNRMRYVERNEKKLSQLKQPNGPSN